MIYVKKIILPSVIFLRLSFYSFTFYSFTDYEGCALRATYSNQFVRLSVRDDLFGAYLLSLWPNLGHTAKFLIKREIYSINICGKLGEGCAVTLTKFLGLRSRS